MFETVSQIFIKRQSGASVVIPADAGIQVSRLIAWIPALEDSAGMTDHFCGRIAEVRDFRRTPKEEKRYAEEFEDFFG